MKENEQPAEMQKADAVHIAGQRAQRAGHYDVAARIEHAGAHAGALAFTAARPGSFKPEHDLRR
jgi:hypothetical protein